MVGFESIMDQIVNDLGGFEWIRTFILLMIPVTILQTVLMIAAVISAARKKVPGRDKVLWILLIVMVNIIGPIIYFAIGSTKLDEKAAMLEDEWERSQNENKGRLQ